jgi:UDP-GlcNAc:undecaprenyl-phosphate GlcNAc-1-phosphate transferase
VDYNLFLNPFVISFAAAIALEVILILLGKKNNFNLGRTSDRHVHKRGISRFGGIALIIAFAAAILLNKKLVITVPIAGILIATGLILIFGIIDDIKQLSWKKQLFFQVCIVSFVYILGVRLEYLTNPFGGIFLFSGYSGYAIGLAIAVIWVMLLMNSINWVDGIDGASAGITLISTATIFLLSLRPEVNQPPVGIITAVLSGCLIAFLLLNFYPARILAGTSGSMFMGFILAMLAIFAGAKIATTLLVLAIPIFDALWVIGERLKSKKSVFLADKRHLHYRLMELGWSQRKICLFYYLITLFIAVVALNTKAVGKIAAFVLIGIVMLAVLFIVSRKIKAKI